MRKLSWVEGPPIVLQNLVVDGHEKVFPYEAGQLRGRITHTENAGDLGYYYYPRPYYVKRSLYIGNVLYTISDKKVMMHNLETLDEINHIEL